MSRVLYIDRARSKGSRRVSGGADYIIPIGLVGIVGYLAYRFIGGLPSLKDLNPAGATNDNNAANTSANASATDTTLKTLASQGQVPSLPDVTLQSIASNVYNMGLVQDNPDLQGIVNSIAQINNMADLTKVIQYFGTKKVASSTSLLDPCYVLGFDCQAMGFADYVNLVFINEPTYKAQLNGFLAQQNIPFQF